MPITGYHGLVCSPKLAGPPDTSITMSSEKVRSTRLKFKGEKTKKKRKVETDDSGEFKGTGEGDGEVDEVESKPKGKGSKQQRFILFVGAFRAFTLSTSRSKYIAGNLKYTTTKEVIQEHFAKACGMSLHS